MRIHIIAVILAIVAVQGARILSDKRGDLPLSTKGKWIVNAKGERVKLAVRYPCFDCLNHLHTTAAVALTLCAHCPPTHMWLLCLLHLPPLIASSSHS